MSYRGGNFYVSAYVAITPTRSKVVAEVQRHTFQEAGDWLDARAQAGRIDEWVERTQQRQSRARRTLDGHWFASTLLGEKPMPEPAAPSV
jgi:hypothetical protein